MPSGPVDQRLDRLEAMVQALAEEIAAEIHGHRDKVVWDDEQGWIMVVENSKALVDA